MKTNHRFGIRLKLVFLTTILAIITYSFSALFIYVLYDYVQDFWSVSEQLFTVITLGLGIFWSGVLAYFAAGYISKPLERLAIVASRAAEGDLDQAIRIPKSDDEIRSLSIAFDAMLKNLRNMVHNIEEHFEGTNKSIVQIRSASNEATQHASLISATTDDISKGAESSAEAIQQTAEDIEEATNLAKEVQVKANQSKEKASDMLETLDDSKSTVNKLVLGIQSLATEQKEALVDVEHLNQNALQVESIVTMVGDIANQTNLLALNASIEAARAGEEGRGFAVVADEVRLLADQSAQAVQRISNLIKAIQADVKRVVDNINKNVSHANNEAESGANTNKAIELMSSSVTDVASEVEMISTLVSRQLDSIQATVRQSQDVAAIAEETSAASQEVNASVQQQASTSEEVDNLAKELEEQALNLRKQIEQFTLK